MHTPWGGIPYSTQSGSEGLSVNTNTVSVYMQAYMCSIDHMYRCSPYPQLSSVCYLPFPILEALSRTLHRRGFCTAPGSGSLAGVRTGTVPHSPCDQLQKLFFWAAVTN